MSVDGLLVIDKPAGPTSHDIVARVRRLAGTRRVGHAGTLDPFATGVMLVLLGRATSLSRFLSLEDKTYEALVSWGAATDTMDGSGRVIATTEAPLPDETSIRNVLAAFSGEIDQVPPMFSAKKSEGTRLYRLARKGIDIERPAVKVRIEDLRLLAIETPGFRLAVRCSKGTYVRALADEIGRALGGAAHLAQLRRTAVGPIGIEAAWTLDGLQAALEQDPLAIERVLIPMRTALGKMPVLTLSESEARNVLYGVAPIAPDGFALEDQTAFRLEDGSGSLLAVARWSAAGRTVEILRVLAAPPPGRKRPDKEPPPD